MRIWTLVMVAALVACEEDPPADLAPGAADGSAVVPDEGLSSDAGDAAVEPEPDGAMPDPDGAAPDPDSALPEPDAAVEPPGDCVPFEGPIEAVLTMRCGFAGCHGGGDPEAGLDLSPGNAYDSLVGVPANQSPGQLRVDPGDPDASYLMAKLSPNPPVGDRMPRGGALSAAEIARFDAWIAGGALRTAAECDDPPPPDPEIARIEVRGPAEIGLGETAELTGVALDEADRNVDVPLRFVSNQPLRLYSDTLGGVLGTSLGEAQVRAVFGGVESDPLTIRVVDADPPGASFRGEVLPLLRGRCGVEGCHTDAEEPGNLHFERDDDRLHRELLEEAEQQPNLERVQPGRPQDSYLVIKLSVDRPPVGGRMPLGQTPLAAEDMGLIVRWILNGAADN